jgi:hypothetical protein
MIRPLSKHPADRIAAAVIAVHFGFLLWWIWTSFAVVDEAGQVASGLATLHTGDTRPYCVNPPLARLVAALPVWAMDANLVSGIAGPAGHRSEWGLAASLVRENPDSYVALIRAARLANLIWSVLLLAVLWRWAGELHGPWGRLIAVSLWCLEPTAITFSGIVVPDVPAAAAGMLASYVFWKYLRAPGWSMAWFAGLSLGLALSTKSTWLILFGVWPLLMLIGKINPISALRPRFRDFLLILPVAWVVFCAGYGFTKMGKPLGEFEFISKSLGGQWEWQEGQRPQITPGNRFRDTSLADVPVPLPADVLVGVDIQKFDFERGLPSYLNGEHRYRGWWHYYLYAMAIKLPIPTLLLVLAGVFWFLWSPRSLSRTDEWAVLFPAIILIAFVSSQTGFNHHMRYVLPAFPCLFLAAGRLAGIAEQQKWLRGAIAALLIWCGTATVSVAPYFMSYFNPLAGGPDNGWRHLIDSNIDWGQDLLHLKCWIEKHPETKLDGVEYYNLFDTKDAGVDAGRVPREPTPGYWAIDVNFVAGSTFRIGGKSPGVYIYFQRFTPIDKAGYSIFIYHITPEEANRVRAEMGLPPWIREALGRP